MFYFLSFCVIIVSGGEYMTINERWKLARKTLNLTQSQVGKKIGVSNARVSAYENGEEIPERSIKAFCESFNVDRFWLTEGEGEMFLEFPDVAIDMIVEDYKLDEIDRLLIQTYIESNDEDRKVIKIFLQTFAKKIEAQKKDE